MSPILHLDQKMTELSNSIVFVIIAIVEFAAVKVHFVLYVTDRYIALQTLVLYKISTIRTINNKQSLPKIIEPTRQRTYMRYKNMLLYK